MDEYCQSHQCYGSYFNVIIFSLPLKEVNVSLRAYHKLCHELFQSTQSQKIDHNPRPVQIHKKNFIIDLPKDSKLTIIFNLLKVSKMTSLRISISPVMEGLQTSNLRSRYTYLCFLEMLSPHTYSDTPLVGCYRVDDELGLLIN